MKKFFLHKATATKCANKQGVKVWNTSSIWRGKDASRKNKVYVVKYDGRKTRA